MLKLGGSPLIGPFHQAMRSGMHPKTFGNQWKRSYHKVRIAQVGPYPKPIDTAESGVKAIDDIFSFAKSQQLFTNAVGCLTFITLPEFWPNGWPTADGNGATFDAERTIPLDTFSAMMKRLRLLARDEAPGTVWVCGGAAIDTGLKLSNGRILGVNVGAIVETGEQGKSALFSKKKHDENDGWDNDKYAEGDPEYANWDLTKFGPGEIATEVGALVRTVEDPSGGKAVTFAAIICADMEKSANLPAKMPQSDVIVATTRGTPMRWQSIWQEEGKVSEYALVAVNDSGDAAAITGPQGVFQYGPESKYPKLAGFHALADWAGFGDFVLSAYKGLFGMPSDAVLAKQFGFQQISTVIHKSDELKVTVAGPRAIGPATDDQPDKT